MKSNMFCVVLLGLFIFTGCTGFNKDPFEGKDNAVKNAVDPSDKPDLTLALPIDAVFLDVPDVVVFKEGKQQTLPIKIRSFLNGYTYSYKVQNLSDLENATFDQAAGLLTWLPKQGTILAADGFVKQYTVNVSVIAKPNDPAGKILSGNRFFYLYVQHDLSKPSIKSVKFPSVPNPLNLEEGTVRNFTVTAEDAEGADVDGMRPKLNFSSRIMQWATVSTTRYLPATKEWEFDVKLDLTNADVTRSLDAFQMDISVVNRLDQMSVVYPVKFNVLTKLGTGTATIAGTTTDFKANTPVTLSFNIYDSSNESTVNLVSYGAAPFTKEIDAKITCESVTSRPFQLCTLTWTPTATGLYLLEMVISTKGASTLDVRPPIQTKVNATLRVNL